MNTYSQDYLTYAFYFSFKKVLYSKKTSEECYITSVLSNVVRLTSLFTKMQMFNMITILLITKQSW